MARKHTYNIKTSDKSDYGIVQGLVKKSIATVLSSLIAFQPILLQAQELQADPSAAASNRPVIDVAPNGVPLVNIATPNAKGLSHNKYNQFNVGTTGLIFNNATQDLQNSQLGGLIVGNSNLVGSGSASIILNEVTSINQSTLEGMMEVHGQAANLIIANPNGVTCNGCGVINTPRATFTTGTPNIGADGSLNSFAVEQGTINIGLKGANLGSVDMFDIVSRKITIDGPIQAGTDLNLVAGRNSYAYQSGLITPLASDGNEPAIAIDSSLLGGMYAGRIKIVSNDQGAGVRTQGQMAANAHGMTLTANGQLILGKIQAKKKIIAKSTSSGIQIKDTLFSDEAIELDGTAQIVFDDNVIAASNGDVSITGQKITLGSNTLVASGTSSSGVQSNNGNLTLNANEVEILEGKVAAGDTLSIVASSVDLSRSTDTGNANITSLGDINITASTIDAQNGRVSAQALLSLNSNASLQINNGIFATSGNLTAQATSISTSAELTAAGQIQLTGSSGNISNSGKVAGDGGLQINAANNISNSGQLFSLASINATATNDITNNSGGQIVSNTSLNLNASGNLTNQGQVAAQGGDLTADVGGDLTNTGTLQSVQSIDLNLDGTLTNSGDILANTSIDVAKSDGTQIAVLDNQSGGNITANSVVLNAQSLSNVGNIKAATGTLTTNSSSSFLNSGTIESLQNLAINTDGSFTNNGTIRSENEIQIAGLAQSAVTSFNTGIGSILNGKQGIIVKATNATNSGATGSANGDLLLEISGNLTNAGLLYAGSNSNIKLDGTLTNTNADILSEGNLIISGLGSARAAALINKSGNIEAISGNLSIAADSVTNERTTLSFGSTSSSSSSSSGSTTTTVTTTRETLDGSSAASKLLAGGNIVIDSNSLTNTYSQIAANGDISISAATVTNTGRDLVETVQTTSTTQHSERYCARRIFGICISRKTRYWTTTSSNTASSTYDAIFGTIEAGGTLNANVSGYLNNNSVRQGAGQIGLASGTRAIGDVDVTSGTTVGNLVTLAALNNDANNLLGRTALFDTAQSPDAPFLIETRSEFIDLGDFFGSDYFLSRFNSVDPDAIIKRLGDAYVETQLLRNQLFQLTGQRLLSGYANEREMLQALYDNAIGEAQRLDLAFGVALTEEQIRSLNSNIIWLEETIINGERVLAPRLYIADQTQRTVNLNSSQIRASLINVVADDIFNSGNIQGVNNLTLAANNSVLNEGGNLFSNADVVVFAGQFIINNSGTIGGNNISLTARDIVSNTAKTRDKYFNGYADRMQQQAQISAANNLNINAANSFTSIGGSFDAGQDLDINAGGSINVASLQLESLRNDEFDGGYDRSDVLTNRLATFNSGRDLSINSGDNITLRGVTVVAVGDVDIEAENNLEIASVQDSFNNDLNINIDTGGFLGTDVDIRRQNAGQNTVSSTIRSGGNTNLGADQGDATLQAIEMFSEGQTTVEAGEDVKVLANIDTSFERDFLREEDIFWWNEADQGQSSETAVQTKINSNGGISIEAGGNIIVDYKATGDFQTSIDQLSSAPGLEWMDQLRNNPDVDWQRVETEFQSWDYESQGLTEAGAAFVSVVVGALTSGALSGLSATIASNLGLSTAIEAAISAGLQSFTKQAAVALINNGGDIGAALKQLGSSDSLRGFATAMVSAGLTTHLTQVAGLNGDLPVSASLADRISEDVQRGLIRASVRAGVTTAIQGGSLDKNLVFALRSEAASVIGENVAQEIGSAYHGGDINKATQLIAHAALGCATGSIAGGDCAGGAAGGVAGEIIGDIQQSRIDAKLRDAIQNQDLTKSEAQELAREMRANGVEMARVVGALSAALAGGDVNSGADAGGNAAENNAFWIPVILIVAAALEVTDKVLIAKDAYDIADATLACQGGSQAACDQAVDLAEQAAIDAGIEFTIGSVIPGSKAAADLLRWTRKNADVNTIRRIDSAADALRLRTELSLQQGNILTTDGRLTSEAVEFADEISLSAGRINNPDIVKELTRDGSDIADWKKYTTQSVPGPNGSNLQVHFYKNDVTGKIDYNTPDFKVKPVVPAIPKTPQ